MRSYSLEVRNLFRSIAYRQIFAHNLEHIAKTEGEDTAIPESSFLQQLFSYWHSRFLRETRHLSVGLAVSIILCRYYISIFCRRISWSNTHENKLCYIRFNTFDHTTDGVEIFSLGEWVARHDDYDLIIGTFLV